MDDTEMAVGVALLIKTNNQQIKMIEFLMQHVENDQQMLSDEEILGKAVEIHETVK